MMAERTVCFILILFVSIEQIVGPPAAIKNHDDKSHDNKINELEPEEMIKDIEFGVEYKRYLDEVVKTLETDEDFKKKVEASSVDDINSGMIANELERVNHHVRSKLDELKRQEVQRLRDLVKKKEELGHGPLHPSEYEHIDHFNLDTFEVKDLNNLIKKVAKDMEQINEMRKQDFKKYEMEKHFEEELKIGNLTETEGQKFKEEIAELKKKHANHEKIHHPGSKAQLEEVWEKQDHLESQDFDPKIFFRLHDIDNNGYWDWDEVQALFVKELDKMYQEGLPEDDMRERKEEMARMREHVFKEMDKNRDGLISYQEFIDETKTKDFNQDEGWDPIEKQQVYTNDEYAAFERQRLEEIRHMIDQGLIPPEHYPHLKAQIQGQYYPHPNQVPQPGYHPNQIPQGYHPNQIPHPNQMPQHPGQVPQHPGQVPQHVAQGQQHPSQGQQHLSQGQQNPGQVPQHPGQGQQHPGQVPQHPSQYNQVPQQQYQQQQVYQQNQHPNQVPQQHYQQPNANYPPPGQPIQNNQQQYQVNQHQQANSQQNQQHQNNQQQQPHPNNQQQQPHPNNQQQPHPNNQQQPQQNSQQQYQSNQQNNQYQNSQPAQAGQHPNQPPQAGQHPNQPPPSYH